MPRDTVDTIIVGQGLAGTVLAWELIRRGQSVLVIDDPHPRTASRIAAGLITPITGQRLVPSWRFCEFWPAAVRFYRRAEEITRRDFFQEIRMVRLFKSEEERRRLLQSPAEEMRTLATFPDPLVDEDDFENAHGGFEMTGGQLDVPVFLAASREWFRQEGAYHRGKLQLPGDLSIGSQGVSIPRLGCRANRVVFCQGFAARKNPWFRGVPFDPAKGEILTIRVPGLCERRVIHRGIWLAPWGGESFRAGATYDREHFDDLPTESGRAEICLKLQSFLKRPFEIVDHQAAVRPIVLGRHPVIGLDPKHPQLGYFNGLGSKGSLQAPFVAEQFAKFLTGKGEIDEILNLQQRFGASVWNG